MRTPSCDMIVCLVLAAALSHGLLHPLFPTSKIRVIMPNSVDDLERDACEILVDLIPDYSRCDVETQTVGQPFFFPARHSDSMR